MMFWAQPMPQGERALAAALRPWERHLTRESAARWLSRGALGALALGSLVLLVGWIAPTPESELRPWALELTVAPLLAAAVVGLWPRKHVQRAFELDARLGLGDRLATAWAFRASDQPIVQLQRVDTIDQLQQRRTRTGPRLRPGRVQLALLGAMALLFLALLVVPSPQQAVLDRQAADQLAFEQAGARLDALRDEALSSPELSPDQARQLNELLQQAQAELSQARSRQEASQILTRTQDQLSQQLDPNADVRDQALAAMSDTLAAEPRTQALGAALQREDAQATSEALKEIAAQADQLADIERQALSRALQRAANVGRADPRSSSALRDAAQALAKNSPDSSRSADAALAAADSALRDAIQASQAQASLNATAQRLRDLQSRLAAGSPLSPDTPRSSDSGAAALATSIALASFGTPVALNAPGSPSVQEPDQAGRDVGAGFGAAGSALRGETNSAAQAAENVFVPGRESSGPASQDLVDKPFTIRGAPRPYRDVLSQYAASSRDYTDRPDISPAVRDLVKQYFQSLEEGS